MGKWIRATGTDMVITFPYMLTYIYLDAGVLELSEIDQFLRLISMTYLGLIRDVVNLICRAAKWRAAIIDGDFKTGGHGNDTTGLTDMGDTPTETGQSKPQTYVVVGISQTQLSSSTTVPRPSISRSILAGYVWVLWLFLSEIQNRLVTVEIKVRLIENRVKP